MEYAEHQTDPPMPEQTTDGLEPSYAELAREVRRRGQYLAATLELTGFGVFTWEIGPDRLSDDSQIDEVLGLPFKGDRSSGALSRMLALVHPDDRPAFKDRLAASLVRGGPEFRSEHRLLLPRPGARDAERWVLVIGRCEFDEDGAPTVMSGVFGDVTARRAEHDERARRDKLEALGTLTSGVAHDFNNVIGAILNFVQLAKREVDAGLSPHESLDEISRGAERASDIVRRLLAFGRDDTPRCEVFDLRTVVAEAATLMAPAMGRDVRLLVDCPRGLPHVDGDPTELHQVVVNLISNARQAIGNRPGRVHVELAVATAAELAADGVPLGGRDWLRLRVSDDGHGISEAVRHRIFDPFFTTREVGKGTGLGLSSAQGIVDRHGGVLTASNGSDGGAIFAAYLPAQEAAGTAHTAAQNGADPERRSDAATEDAAAAGDARCEVCFVDDEEALATLARRALPLSGCAVEVFTDPEVALAWIAANPEHLDVLITDFSMPGMSGLELVKAARELVPDLPVVLTSGHLDREDLADAERLRVEAIVRKPCTMADLAAAAARLLAA